MSPDHPFVLGENLGEVAFSLGHWRKIEPYLQRGELLPGNGVKIVKNKVGQIISLRQSESFKHPWWIEPQFLQGEWVLQVRPGFINGIAPFNKEGVSIEEEEGFVRVEEFSPTRNPPKFLQRLGVSRGGEGAKVLLSDGGVEVQLDSESNGNRSALQTEVIIYIRRPRMKVETNIIDPTGISGRVVDRAIVLDAEGVELIPKIVARRSPPEEKTFDVLQILLNGTIDDDGLDTLRIATVYWVSPTEDGGNSDFPSPNWVSFVEYHTFWNLGYAFPYNPLRAPGAFFLPIPWVGSGAASAVAGMTVAPMMDLVDTAAKALLARNYVGQFWSV